MTINTQRLRDQLDIVHSDQCEDETQFEAAQQIIAAAPELLDRADRVEALDIIVRSVATALERHGVKDVDDPGEAIDVLVADKDREIARLRSRIAELRVAVQSLLDCPSGIYCDGYQDAEHKARIALQEKSNG